jgi:hypothetical protein
MSSIENNQNFTNNGSENALYQQIKIKATKMWNKT